MNKIAITSEDIMRAEIVLDIPNRFDHPRRDIIECMESRDVVACPGSGKTTILLAKLIILASKMPFDNNKGICVLTHTNVAIDEIKDKLGDRANILLSYPNYVGTIQSFVDRYLAIPASIQYCGVRPVAIDTDVFNAQFIRTFNAMFKGMEQGFNAFCVRNYIGISDLRLSLEDGCIYKGNKLFVFKKDADKKYENKLKTVFKILIKRGVFRFDMAFEIADKYFSEHEYELKPILTERFPFVFVDEMQDTNSIQMTLLDKMFDRDKLVFQCFGDPKQAIYDSLDQEGAWTPCNYLPITNSKRFTNNIAKVVDCIAVKPQSMSGTADSEIPPIVITYMNNDVCNVLPIFAQLISHFNLQTEEKPVFKAVGMVKGNEKLGIKNYYPTFDKANSKTNLNRDFPCLSMYLTKLSDDILSKQGTRAYYNRFINAMLKVLRLAGIKTSDGKYFSKTTLIKHLKETDERFYIGMHRIFAKCILFVEADKNILNHFRSLLVILLRRLGKEPNLDVLDFFNNTAALELIRPIPKTQCNIYEFEGIQIEIDTVHGVKGQTHSATLYMETFCYGNAVENIIEYFVGRSRKKLGLRAEKHLKIAYVAMTRPQKLLCVTMKEEVFEQHKEALNSQGWIKYDEFLRNGFKTIV